MTYVLQKKNQYIMYLKQNTGDITKPDSLGKATHTNLIKYAFKYPTKQDAINEQKRLSKIAKGFDIKEYHPEEKEKITSPTDNSYIRLSQKEKRKSFSPYVRTEVYRKTKGHCYICGTFVDFNQFEIEHRIPLHLGGTNDISNLFCSCHICNTMKSNLPLNVLLEQSEKITRYQERKHRKAKATYFRFFQNFKIKK